MDIYRFKLQHTYRLERIKSFYPVKINVLFCLFCENSITHYKTGVSCYPSVNNDEVCSRFLVRKCMMRWAIVETRMSVFNVFTNLIMFVEEQIGDTERILRTVYLFEFHLTHRFPNECQLQRPNRRVFTLPLIPLLSLISQRNIFILLTLVESLTKGHTVGGK